MPHPPPILETERLILRPMRIEDAEAHFRYINDWEVARYLGASFPWPYPEGGSVYFLTKYTGNDVESWFWAITHKERGEFADEMIGIIELRPQQTEGQRGFWLGRAFHGQGIMTEAAAITNDFWFDKLKKPFLNMHNASTNLASRRIKEKTGAKLIGLKDSTNYLDPSFTQTEIWELTAEDWHRFRAA